MPAILLYLLVMGSCLAIARLTGHRPIRTPRE